MEKSKPKLDPAIGQILGWLSIFCFALGGFYFSAGGLGEAVICVGFGVLLVVLRAFTIH